MPTYFGACNSDGSLTDSETDDSNDTIMVAYNDDVTYTCPGSGAQNVVAIECRSRVNVAAGAPSSALGIYSNDGTTLICYGTSAEAVVGGLTGGMVTIHAGRDNRGRKRTCWRSQL